MQSPEKKDLNKEILEHGLTTLKEAEQELEESHVAQAQWRVRAVFGNGAMLSALSAEAQKALKEADQTLEKTPEITALRAIQRALDEIEE